MERTYSVRRVSDTPTESTLPNLFRQLLDRQDLAPYGFFGEGEVEVLIQVGGKVVQHFGAGRLSDGAFYPIEADGGVIGGK